MSKNRISKTRSKLNLSLGRFSNPGLTKKSVLTETFYKINNYSKQVFQVRNFPKISSLNSDLTNFERYVCFRLDSRSFFSHLSLSHSHTLCTLHAARCTSALHVCICTSLHAVHLSLSHSARCTRCAAKVSGERCRGRAVVVSLRARAGLGRGGKGGRASARGPAVAVR